MNKTAVLLKIYGIFVRSLQYLNILHKTTDLFFKKSFLCYFYIQIGLLLIIFTYHLFNIALQMSIKYVLCLLLISVTCFCHNFSFFELL